MVKASENSISDLLEQPFSPEELLVLLESRNVFLTPDLQRLTNTQGIFVKKEELESLTLREISKACLKFHFQLSIWNSKAKNQSIIMRTRHNPEFDEEFHENTDQDWVTVQFKIQKCKILKILENSKEFSKERYPNSVSHLNWFYLVNENKEKFRVDSYEENFTDQEILLIDTVYKLLQPIHLFALCF